MFRGHIEKTSDIALSGHQHYPHEFDKANSTGERIAYVEAAALQDENYGKTSQFQVLLFDLDSGQKKSTKFRRSRDLYRPVEDSGWQQLVLNRAIRPEFRLSDGFEALLNESTTPLHHKIKGLLKLRDIFVLPDLLAVLPEPRTSLARFAARQSYPTLQTPDE